MSVRLSLLTLTAAAAGVSVLANGIAAAVPGNGAEPTRLGASIRGDMSARDRVAAQRSRALNLREQAARATEARLRAAAASRPPASTPADQAPSAAPDSSAQFDELARIYQAMKPKAAATVFEQLAMDVQVEVAERMRERSTAQIMAAMTPKGAAALTMAMARRGPGPGWTPVSPAAR